MTGIYLPPLMQGKGWSAEKLSKPGTRAGMRCIYKIKVDGQSKRAGVYVQQVDGDKVIINLAGDNFELNLKNNTIEYNPRYRGTYSNLVNDQEFARLLQNTLAHFGYLKVENGQFQAPPPKIVILTEAEVEAIGDFGIF